MTCASCGSAAVVIVQLNNMQINQSLSADAAVCQPLAWLASVLHAIAAVTFAFSARATAPTRERLSDYIWSLSRHIDLPAEGMGRNNPHKNTTGLTENDDIGKGSAGADQCSAYNLPNVDVHGILLAVVAVVRSVPRDPVGTRPLNNDAPPPSRRSGACEAGTRSATSTAARDRARRSPPPCRQMRPSQGSPETQSPSSSCRRAVRHGLDCARCSRPPPRVRGRTCTRGHAEAQRTGENIDGVRGRSQDARAATPVTAAWWRYRENRFARLVFESSADAPVSRRAGRRFRRGLSSSSSSSTSSTWSIRCRPPPSSL